MIALRPVRVSWQKTTCSCSLEPFPRGDDANTFVTVVTLLVPSRSGLNRDRKPAYCWGAVKLRANTLSTGW
jgi:hypothetical protein